MNVNVQTQGFDLTPSIGARVHGQVMSALDSYKSEVISVDVFLKDINGPKGGADKQAGVRLHIRHLAPIAVVSTHVDLYGAIDDAARRARRSARRAISRYRRVTRRGLRHHVVAATAEAS